MNDAGGPIDDDQVRAEVKEALGNGFTAVALPNRSGNGWRSYVRHDDLGYMVTGTFAECDERHEAIQAMRTKLHARIHEIHEKRTSAAWLDVILGAQRRDIAMVRGALSRLEALSDTASQRAVT